MPQGAELAGDGKLRFRLWAPGCEAVGVLIDEAGAPRPMKPAVDGWHELTTDGHAGTLYRFVLPDGLRVPDPASRFQPQDVHGPSEVIDPTSFRWTDTAWQGRPWHETVAYELHIGSFTPEGSFRAAIDKLDHLVALGVTALEVMPVADFPGSRNWGYDGVLLYAPDSSYGRPDDFRALVDAAHARGLSVLLDVVYNHFGPDGNYFPAYAPALFTERHHTPWGAAINYDGASSRPVREYVIHNALYWIEEFHLDGLRLDAVHAIIDDSPIHLLTELAERARALAAPRPVHLVLENEENAASRLARGPDGAPRFYTAQWNDDVHHVLHTAVTGQDSGYYKAYHGETGLLGRALAEGFAFQGEVMPYRDKERGEPSGFLPPGAFVAFIQNHDQVGNRAFGDRLPATVPPHRMRAIAAVYLLLPQVPMLFMGEEWSAAEPFPFFCDFEGELAEAVRQGRRKGIRPVPRVPGSEAARAHPRSAGTGDIRLGQARLGRISPSRTTPPRSPGTRSILGVASRQDRAVAARDRRRRRQLRCRRARCRHGALENRQWRGTLLLAANLSDAPVADMPPPAGEKIWLEGEAADGAFAPWTVRWSRA